MDEYWFDYTQATTREVIESTEECYQSAVLDANGEPFVMWYDRQPIGFDLTPKQKQ